MISGRQALGSIDQSLNQARDHITMLQSQITAASERVLVLQQAQLEDYRNLASVRLDELIGGDVMQHLDSTERQVMAILEKRDVLLGDLNKAIDENALLRQGYEKRREQQAARLDAAVAVVDQAEQATQRRLDSDAAYRAQRELAESFKRKALHARDKAERSAEEREQKGAAYENDPLFMYLWQRSYGLPDYKGRGLFRWLDGKVASLVGFPDARANYTRLKEIPQRLQEHARHLDELAEAEFSRLRELDELALSADGIPALEEKVVGEQQALDSLDQQIDERESRHQALLEERAAYAAGEDPQMREAIEYLAHEFQRDDLADLRRAAMQTPYPEDDVVISRMLSRDQERQQLESSVEGLKDALRQHRDRVVELEQLRADFKRNRFDRAGSVFADDAIVPALLGEFLAGLLDRQMLWRVLREHQRYRPRRSDPDFGSGGFGRGTVWKGGLGDLGDIIGSLGRGGVGRGGRSGGGGGGFRTGGGF